MLASQLFDYLIKFCPVFQLFSQVLLGYKTEKDLDTLVNRLEEHHGLLTQMAENNEDSETSTALPKLLLELVSQIEEANTAEPQITETTNEGALNGTIIRFIDKVVFNMNAFDH